MNLIEQQFPPKALIKGLRSIGYSFSTAVADLIDNCISAGATEININSDPLAKEPYFCILDNGCGMDEPELENAMLFGSNRDNKFDHELELGRFGLGLKSASLSQCRKFIVVSKKSSEINALAFDLDVVEEKNKLFLEKYSEKELIQLPHVNELCSLESGTLVIWTKFDKIQGSARKFEDSFRNLVADSKKHVEMVFHRFYDSLSIYYNGKRIEERDPFLLASQGRQQTGRVTPVMVDGQKVLITPYTLPFTNTLTMEEKNLLGNPKSIFDDQGLYLYRNHRLIAWGSWMRMGIKSEFNKLARVQIDIPSTLDSVWMLDVKKSSANIPDKIKQKIKTAIEDSIVRSRRTTRFPGVKEQAVTCKVWDRIKEHDGKIRYEISRNTPSIVALYQCLGNNERNLLDIALSQIESYLPKYSISNDNIDSLLIANANDDIEEEHLIQEIVDIMAMYDQDKKEEYFEKIFITEAYQKLYDKKEIIRKRVFGDVRHK